MRRAQEHRHLDAGRHAWRGPRDREVVEVEPHAAVPRVAAPGRLPDDVAFPSEAGLGEVNDPGPIQEAQPERLAVEHVLVVVRRAGEVPMEWLQIVNLPSRRLDIRWTQDRRDE